MIEIDEWPSPFEITLMSTPPAGRSVGAAALDANGRPVLPRDDRR
ncbi:hypothetical protein [Micromonospora sp. A202]|nr:hypothetical protein [Micromonospora sp. A202]